MQLRQATASVTSCALLLALALLLNSGVHDALASRHILAYEVAQGTVTYSYAGARLPDKLVDDEDVSRRTENSYTRDLGEATGLHTYQAVIVQHPVYVKEIGGWHYRETATTTETAFYQAHPERALARMFSTAVAYAASFSGFSTTADADVSTSLVGGIGDPVDFSFCMDEVWGQSSSNTDLTILVRSQGSTAGNGSCNIHVAHLPFDTSSIPLGSSVSAGTLSVYVTAKSGNDGGDLIDVPQSSASPNLYTIIAGTSGATSLDITSDITTSAYNTFTLNASGLSWVTPGGTSYFALRERHSQTGIPGSTVYNITISSADETGTSQDPTLAVTYTEGTRTIYLRGNVYLRGVWLY